MVLPGVTFGDPTPTGHSLEPCISSVSQTSSGGGGIAETIS